MVECDIQTDGQTDKETDRITITYAALTHNVRRAAKIVNCSAKQDSKKNT